MNRLLRVGLLLLTAVIMGLCGCGPTASERPARTATATEEAPTVTETRTEGPAESAPPPTSEEAPPAEGGGAAATVEGYFAAINAQDYDRAWKLGGKNLTGDYDTFVEGFAETEEDTVHVVGTEGDTVTIELSALQSDGAVKEFRGTYTVHDGVIVSSDVHEVSAPEQSEPEPGESSSPYYENCDDVRNQGKAPLLKGEPGYESPRLDGDGDGTACAE